MLILGIETSCDETSLAVLELSARQLKLRAHLIASQTKLHAKWGGVVPELAARRHTEVIIPLLHQTLRQAKAKSKNLDLIAVTQGPGLITALQVGVETAKALAFGWNKPLIGVNHIAGHLVSPFLSTTIAPWLRSSFTGWPAVALVVSGGHTELYLMKSLLNWKLLGKTLDDAAGEAFDKVAKLLGLPYPGGPAVSMLAEKGDSTAFALPRPMITSKDFNFSFAGLKTAVLYTLQKQTPYPLHPTPYTLKQNICASFQAAAVDVLVSKTLRAVQAHKARSILVVGGVSANRALRQRFATATKRLRPTPYTLLPDLAFTGDNAAMIALAGGLEARERGLGPYQSGWRKLNAKANWELW